MDNNKEIHNMIDEIFELQSRMSAEERMKRYAKSIYTAPLDYVSEINGTQYIVRTFFDENASESISEKAKRIIMKK